MTKRILMLTTVTLALVCGGIPARAQEDFFFDHPAMMQHSEEAQQNQGDEEGTRMMGHGMMRQCMRQCMAEDGRMDEGVEEARHDAPQRRDGPSCHAHYLLPDGSRR